MERAALVCTQFAEMARSFNAEQIIAVATSTAREASNKRRFLRLLRQASDVDVHIISGREEARLVHLGVASGAHLNGESGLFIDVGGGSTEVAVGDQNEHEFLDSLPLGAIRLTEMFFEGKAG